MTWDALRPVLVELGRRNPRPVKEGPDPHVVGPRRSPFRLHLEPWAEAEAAALHRQFGSEVILSVGYFGYPTRVRVDALGRPAPDKAPAPERAALVDPTILSLDLTDEVTVASGHDADATVVMANHSSHVIGIRRLRSVIVDPANGATVGATMHHYSPTTPRPRDVAPKASIRVPLRIGTASLDPSLGYSVPPGDWSFRVFIDHSAGPTVRAPLLPITIT